MIALLLSGATSFFAALFGMPVLIRFLARQGIGQPIRADGPQAHMKKKGTPTMGGIVIVLAAVTGYIVPHLFTETPFSRRGMLVVFAVVGAAVVGLADDWIKITRKRSLGLNKRAKTGGLLVVATTFSLLAVHWPVSSASSRSPASTGRAGPSRPSSGSSSPACWSTGSRTR